VGSPEQIWAPWRIDYILGLNEEHDVDADGLDLLPGADPSCFICQAVGDTADRQRYVVRRTSATITVLNRYPYNSGHLLIAPKRHVCRLDELTAQESSDLSGEITSMVGLLEKTVHPQGFNIGLNLGRVAGAGLPGHLHWHVVPRWNGDTNFMPVLASVDVIPQALDALWELLTDELAK
jgi:ATP adenylyltransferase